MRKKYILIIILFTTIFITKVNAETYYGEYFEVSNTNNIPKDEFKIEEYYLYNSFNIIKQDMGYLENNNEYIKDINDYILKDNIIEQYNINSDEYISLHNKIIYTTKISLKNIPENSKIYEIYTYKEDEPYIYSVNAPYINNIRNLYDNNEETYSHSTNDLSTINISFDKKIVLKDLKLIIVTKKDKDYNIDISINDSLNQTINLKNDIDKKHIISFYDGNDEPTYLYNNPYKIYKYYKEEQVKTDNYIETGNNILLDDKLTRKRYFKRDKLVIKDINEVETNFTPQSLIEYSSSNVIANCRKIDNIFKCTYNLNNINITKEYSIKETTLKLNPIRLSNTKKSKNIKKNIVNINKNNKSIVTTKRTTTKKTNVITTKNSIINKKEKNNKDNKSNISIIIKYIIISIILIIEITTLIKKKKKNCRNSLNNNKNKL